MSGCRRSGCTICGTARHGAASLALEAGASLKVIQDQLGHASIVLTADTYVSVEPDLARRAAESTARLVLRDSRYVPGTKRVRRGEGMRVSARRKCAV